jgi:anti-sigma regulatory factor (Ser/Thr protein kinase)/ABC-type transporter Mla MlaB component
MLAANRYASYTPDARAATLCVVVLDPSTGRLEYSTAGHPPPLVVRPSTRQARYLEHSGAAPLATTGEMSVSTDEVDCGDLVVLYSDGLLARPGRDLAGSTVELGQVALDAASDPQECVTTGPGDRVCEKALELTTRRSGYRDDVAVLVAEVIEPVPPLHLDLPADDNAVPEALDALAEWLESMRVRDLDHIVVQHAVDELVSNIVDHAYEVGAGPTVGMTIDAELLTSGDLQVQFTDAGRWSGPRRGAERGRGLPIVRGMVDHLEVVGAETGTVATIRHRLSRPARMLTGFTTSRGARSEPASVQDDVFSIALHGTRLRVAGPLDSVHVDDLRGALSAAQDGTRRLVVDLARVTHLASSAIALLHAAHEEAAVGSRDLLLYAPPGTTAQHVLELVRLPYAPTDPDDD